MILFHLNLLLLFQLSSVLKSVGGEGGMKQKCDQEKGHKDITSLFKRTT